MADQLIFMVQNTSNTTYTATNHTALYYNGKYHDELYHGSTLVWSKQTQPDPDPEPSSGITVSVKKQANWQNNGLYYYQITLTVTNTGTTAVTSWTVSWQAGIGVQIVGEWSSVSVVYPTTGKVETSNISYNGNLAASASIDIHLQISCTSEMP